MYFNSVTQTMDSNQCIFFGVISYNKDIGWTVIKINYKGENTGFNIYYDTDHGNETYIQLYKQYLNNNTGTMFVLPDIMLSNIKLRRS